MTLKVYNTLTGQKEEFIPLDPPNVRMYVCGITPYDETHVGHARAYVTFDIVQRYLRYLGYKVTYVQNITDIDDKIITKGQGSWVKCQEITKQYTDSYFEVMKKLSVDPADHYPKATETIPDMIKVIQGLIDKGYAYVVEGPSFALASLVATEGKDVYFEVAKFKDYGKLSKRKQKDMLAGARVEIDERKKDPIDFALWKKAKEGEPSWDSPWGTGRPGWHIECSTMSNKLLGETFDIHGGGRDLIFPHHENEIAQAEAYTGKPFVKYWMHNGFVNINQQKMSKSLGNFFTLKDVFKKFDPMVVRFFLLSTHYRSPVEFSDEQLVSAREAYRGLVNLVGDIDFLVSKSSKFEVLSSKLETDAFEKDFLEAMDDDFNTAGALAVIFNMVSLLNKQIKAGQYDEGLKTLLLDLVNILGIKLPQEEKLSPEEEKMVAEREAARKNKDFAKADAIKLKLKENGITIEDTPYGTRWKKI